MDNKRFKNLMELVKRKDSEDSKQSEAEELRRLIRTACTQLVDIYEYADGDFRFKYYDVHYTVTMDRVGIELPNKIHIIRCIEGSLITRDIDIDEPGDDASKNLELMNEAITNWFRSKGVCR
jgi:hypothetical protein